MNCLEHDWYTLWKSFGGSVVNVVPWEVPQVIGTSLGITWDNIHHTTPSAFPVSIPILLRQTTKICCIFKLRFIQGEPSFLPPPNVPESWKNKSPELATLWNDCVQDLPPSEMTVYKTCHPQKMAELRTVDPSYVVDSAMLVMVSPRQTQLRGWPVQDSCYISLSILAQRENKGVKKDGVVSRKIFWASSPYFKIPKYCFFLPSFAPPPLIWLSPWPCVNLNWAPSNYLGPEIYNGPGT